MTLTNLQMMLVSRAWPGALMSCSGGGREGGGGRGEVLQASLSCLGGICRAPGLGLARTMKRTFQGKMNHMGPLAEKLDPVPCSASDFPWRFGDGKSSDLPLPIL